MCVVLGFGHTVWEDRSKHPVCWLTVLSCVNHAMMCQIGIPQTHLVGLDLLSCTLAPGIQRASTLILIPASSQREFPSVLSAIIPVSSQREFPSVLSAIISCLLSASIPCLLSANISCLLSASISCLLSARIPCLLSTPLILR